MVRSSEEQVALLKASGFLTHGGCGTLLNLTILIYGFWLSSCQAFFDDLINDESFVRDRRYVLRRRLGMRVVDGVTSSVTG